MVDELEYEVVTPLARMILSAVHREYPNQVSHRLEGDHDVRPPRLLTPVFYGSYDWHSAVHGHWALTRLLRLFPSAPFAVETQQKLDASFRAEKIAGELDYLRGTGRRGRSTGWLQSGARTRRMGSSPTSPA